MARTDAVDLVFWGVIFFVVTALIGLYNCKNWQTFLQWIMFLGLLLDAIGALALVLSEFGPIQAFLWPGLIASKNKIEAAKTDDNFNSHRPFIEQGDDGFKELTAITRDRRTISNPEMEHDRVEIEEFRFWPRGEIYADGINVHQVTVAYPDEVQSWISDRITTLTRDKVYPYAALILFTGFSLQILSYWLRNF
ncbi:hypothetical protein [Halorubrum sp. F4]|uniref:hypothetical protein n=1 Tax=Halorubrum sp. F4 TaxID=2989715 RepID=UPI0024812951|nr:hypothetical protein [Halorubrum sp. F4]